jgi:hypothetical protein
MGKGQRHRGNSFQAGEEGQEAIKRSWKGGDHRRNESQMGQSERHEGHIEGSQKGGSAQQSGR